MDAARLHRMSADMQRRGDFAELRSAHLGGGEMHTSTLAKRVVGHSGRA